MKFPDPRVAQRRSGEEEKCRCKANRTEVIWRCDGGLAGRDELLSSVTVTKECTAGLCTTTESYYGNLYYEVNMPMKKQNARPKARVLKLKFVPILLLVVPSGADIRG